MDAGADREVRSVEQLVAAGGAPTSLDGSRVIAVMDRLLCLEAAWHLGHFLPQSVYTCLYMLLPDRCVHHNPLSVVGVLTEPSSTIILSRLYACS